MQENRSFDSYFGTYPGADGIPTRNGVPTVCLPDPETGRCVRPFHDRSDLNQGSAHDAVAARKDIVGGKMNGFVTEALRTPNSCGQVDNPFCAGGNRPLDVMGYHTGAELPNYWAYARHFVLQDHMFEPNASWSLPAHLFLVSEWSARCSTHNPMSCRNALNDPVNPDLIASSGPVPIYAWTDLTYLLYKHHVSWRYYVMKGTQPDCADSGDVTCSPVKQNARTPGIWNPLPYFDTVKADHQEGNIQNAQQLLPRREDRHTARGVVGNPGPDRQRPPTRAGQPRPDLRDWPDQRDHEEPRLVIHSNLPDLG